MRVSGGRDGEEQRRTAVAAVERGGGRQRATQIASFHGTDEVHGLLVVSCRLWEQERIFATSQ
jgi:hypothetical protein